jgi:excinuclease ABC subunit C
LTAVTSLEEKRASLPDAPGVYLLYDRTGEPIYVGKARSIRKRVASHFSKGRTPAGPLAGEVADIDFVVTATEAEALLTEQQFIKRHRPKLNIRLRDDKSYPYIAISLDEAFPRVYMTRERHRPGRVYFGPYASAKRVRETLEVLGKLFQFRTCEGPEPGRRSGVPCLDYHIERCSAPCVGYISQDEYRAAIEGVIGFLSGRHTEIESDLKRRMEAASRDHEFERAAALRDRLAAVRSLLERQRVAGSAVGTADVVGIAITGGDANAQVFQLRDGVLAGRQGFYLATHGESDPAEVAEQFLSQYYASAPSVPGLIVVGEPLAERAAVISEALSDRRGARVEVRVARRGEKRRLRELAERNAELALTQQDLKRERARRQRVDALSELADALGLDELPVRIEGFDISNIGAEHTVASMVVFEGGTPKKSDYRRFRVRRPKDAPPPRGSDDFAAMRSILERRAARWVDQADLSPHDSGRDESFASRPGLILIDGGKGQLSAAMQGGGPLFDAGVRPVAIAKREEELFVPGRSAPVLLPNDSEALRLLRRVRDEAHRFAIEHHRTRRGKAMTESALDGLVGVGPARKRALIAHFGSAEAVAGASEGELEAVPGMPGKVARSIHRQLNRAG